MNTLIVILGPTGVGKSAISIELAKFYSTDIISADSRQLFSELSIGTAVPSVEDLKSVSHHFIQTRSIHQYYNVSEYETEAIELINQLFKIKNPLILTGGSMLYIDTICKGIDDIPTVTPEIRKQVMDWYDQNGLEALQQRLLTLDPEYYNLADLNNPKRLLHAVEVCLMTGKTFTSFRTNTIRQRPFRILKIGINQQREVLYERINRRVDLMMDAGLLEEARAFTPIEISTHSTRLATRSCSLTLTGTVPWRRPLTSSSATPASMPASNLPGFEKIPIFIGLNPTRYSRSLPLPRNR